VDIQLGTRKLTESEQVEREIRQSMREDLRPGVKPHESGHDVKSIALEEIESLQQKIAREKDRQELTSLKSILALFDDARADIQKRILELNGERVTAGSRRVLELAEASARAARR